MPVPCPLRFSQNAWIQSSKKKKKLPPRSPLKSTFLRRKFTPQLSIFHIAPQHLYHFTLCKGVPCLKACAKEVVHCSTRLSVGMSCSRQRANDRYKDHVDGRLTMKKDAIILLLLRFHSAHPAKQMPQSDPNLLHLLILTHLPAWIYFLITIRFSRFSHLITVRWLHDP